MYHFSKVSFFINPLNANPTKWSDTLKQFASKLPTNCLIVFDHLVKLALKGLNNLLKELMNLQENNLSLD